MVNLALLYLRWPGHEDRTGKLAALPQDQAELIRRLVRSHVAASELLEVCSAADAVAASPSSRHTAKISRAQSPRLASSRCATIPRRQDAS
jgi:hypothetical protein